MTRLREKANYAYIYMHVCVLHVLCARERSVSIDWLEFVSDNRLTLVAR